MEPGWIFEHLRPLGIQPSSFMQTLRRGAYDEARFSDEWTQLYAGSDVENRRGYIPIFPFTLTPEQQEQMLSAHLSKHGLPSVWYGEGSSLELRRERFKRVRAYARTCYRPENARFRDPPTMRDLANPFYHVSLSTWESARRSERCALQCLLEVVHRRRRDRCRQRCYEIWKTDANNDAEAKTPAGRASFWDRKYFTTFTPVPSNGHVPRCMCQSCMYVIAPESNTAVLIHSAEQQWTEAGATLAEQVDDESVLEIAPFFSRHMPYPRKMVQRHEAEAPELSEDHGQDD